MHTGSRRACCCRAEGYNDDVARWASTSRWLRVLFVPRAVFFRPVSKYRGMPGRYIPEVAARVVEGGRGVQQRRRDVGVNMEMAQCMFVLCRVLFRSAWKSRGMLGWYFLYTVSSEAVPVTVRKYRIGPAGIYRRFVAAPAMVLEGYSRSIRGVFAAFI